MTVATASSEPSLQQFTVFLDALYSAALGEARWSSVLEALHVLGRHDGEPARRALYDAALRHVRHAVAIAQRLGHESRRAAVLERTAATLPCGLLLVDARLSVLFATDRAQALLRQRNGVQLEAGRLRSLRGLEDRALARALSRLLVAPRDAIGALCITLPAHGRQPALRLLLMRATADAGDAPTVLLLAFEQDVGATLPRGELLRDIYGFSAAEAELAGLLLAGKNLLEAARTRSVSMNTAKSQLRNVLRKTGSRNQADLMRTLIAGPAGLLQGLGAFAQPPRP